jgi:hypothetical protein
MHWYWDLRSGEGGHGFIIQAGFTGFSCNSGKKWLVTVELRGGVRLAPSEERAR